jgi:hypothetical protein
MTKPKEMSVMTREQIVSAADPGVAMRNRTRIDGGSVFEQTASETRIAQKGGTQS